MIWPERMRVSLILNVRAIQSRTYVLRASNS